jgi:hypothetical protein
MIRAAAVELSHPIAPEDALDIRLALLELEPHTYPQTATRWGGRLAIQRKLALVDAQLAFAALAALPGLGAKAGAEAVIEISGRRLPQRRPCSRYHQLGRSAPAVTLGAAHGRIVGAWSDLCVGQSADLGSQVDRTSG